MYYVGRKLFRFAKKKRVRGRARRVFVRSDFENYYGSNERLKKQVELHGREKFTRKILRLCKSKSELNYYEAHEQFVRGVLLDDRSYNDWISVKVRRTQALKGNSHV